VVKDSFLRENIGLQVIHTEDKKYRLKQFCSKAKRSTIVYVRTRRSAEELAQYLEQNGCKATFFHGGIPKEEKEKRLGLWLSDTVHIMVATNAFGMGIDKPDVSLVVHFQIPDCLENYFQEAGRAGRNGLPARAVLLTNAADQQRAKDQFLRVLPEVSFLKTLYKKLNAYFQIAYGEGSQQTFSINFEVFCDTYKFNRLLAYNALRILDLNSVLALSESFSRTTTVQFLTDKNGIFAYMDKNESTHAVIQTLLRTYGGIFDFETKINIQLISKKSGIGHGRIVATLEKLQADGIITYLGKTNDLEITFLVPREDDHTINTLAPIVREQNSTKQYKLMQMLAYVNNASRCRNRIVLDYFGENLKQDCGRCDVCLGKTRAKPDMASLCDTISELLGQEKKTSRQLISLLSYPEQIVLSALKCLLEEGKIQITQKNEYELI
ncbi:MAG: helicase-related protein, partial [Bacteroidota bacterium]